MCRGETSIEPDTGSRAKVESYLRKDSGMPSLGNVFLTPAKIAEATAQNVFLVNTKPIVILPKVASGTVVSTPTPQ